MRLKGKIADFIDKINKSKTSEYDKILSCSVKGEVKGAFMTIDCNTVKLLSDKCKKGLIDVGEILDEEFDNSELYHQKEIIFCDKDNVMCIYNSKNNAYYEDGYEYFEPAEERVYVRCDSDASYDALKNFVNQSSKYHNFIEYEYEIPQKKAFDKLFSENKSEEIILIEEKSNYEKMER